MLHKAVTGTSENFQFQFQRLLTPSKLFRNVFQFLLIDWRIVQQYQQLNPILQSELMDTFL